MSISPSSAIFTSTPSIGLPTVPILNMLFAYIPTATTGEVSVNP